MSCDKGFTLLPLLPLLVIVYKYRYRAPGGIPRGSLLEIVGTLVTAVTAPNFAPAAPQMVEGL